METTLRVLTVCTHNRTRSVLAWGLIGQYLHEAGVDFRIASAGFVAAGEPATERTVRLLRRRGMELSGHRSRLVDARLVELADLIVCAEHRHVLDIAGSHPGSFGRTFTLPELVRLGEAAGPARGDVSAWLERISERRIAQMDYLDADPQVIGELFDPTGEAPAVWDRVFEEIDDLAARVARLLAS